MSSEPYFYDLAYQITERNATIPVNETGQCIVAEQLVTTCKDASTDKGVMRWKCTSECKTVSLAEVDAIVKLLQTFKTPMDQVRIALDSWDRGCPNGHYYVKVLDTETFGDFGTIRRRGHPLVCFNDGGCDSKIRILRAASTHYPKLRTFLHYLHNAIRSHVTVREIDQFLGAGNFCVLMQMCEVETFECLLCDREWRNLEATDTEPTFSESRLLVANAILINDYEKQLLDDPDHVCCSSERLHRRKSVSKLLVSGNLGSIVWPKLKAFILQNNETEETDTLFMCTFCKSRITNDTMPPRCVLNGLQSVTVPAELAKLDSLSLQLLQRAKFFQTVVRLGTYTGKVSTSNALRACRGVMFYLPLLLAKTLDTLDKVEDSNILLPLNCSLPEPELYVIVNGKPTKAGVLWRTLVNVNSLKQVIQKLKEINWLYKNVAVQSIDEATRKVMAISNNATNTMLEKASTDDIAGFQHYTIRNLNSKLNSGSDLEQYKILSATEQGIDNRLKHLDVMCFPALFSTGEFGEFHPRKTNLLRASMSNRYY